jgi:hypothetical protein
MSRHSLGILSRSAERSPTSADGPAVALFTVVRRGAGQLVGIAAHVLPGSIHTQRSVGDEGVQHTLADVRPLAEQTLSLRRGQAEQRPASEFAPKLIEQLLTRGHIPSIGLGLDPVHRCLHGSPSRALKFDVRGHRKSGAERSKADRFLKQLTRVPLEA